MADEAMDTAEAIALPNDLHSHIMSRFQNSIAPEHQHLCAVVGAMAQVLSEQGLPSSPTAYFAATMSALERQCVDNNTSIDDPVNTALCTFLALVLPKISHAVLQSKCRAALSLLVGVAGDKKVAGGALKPAFSCIALLLCAADKSDWPVIAPSFNVLVKHCLDERPKVRKRAHECTAEVLRGFQASPALEMASEVIVTLLEKSISAVSGNKGANCGGKVPGTTKSMEALQILYLLNALKLLLPSMSVKSVGKVLAYFSKLLELRQPFLSRQILNTMQPFCMDPSVEIPPAGLTDVLEKLAAMLSQEKKAGDESMAAARVLTKGMERLYAVDPQLCARKLPLAFQSLAGMLAFEQEEAVYAGADCLKILIDSCVDNSLLEQGRANLQSRGESWNKGPSLIEKICVTATSTLGYQFSSAWDVCLQVVAALFDKLGACSFALMQDTVKALSDLEELSDENLTCRRQLHKTIGAAVAAMGPDHFLTLLPLNIESEDLSNARLWLLPILRQNIVGAQLKFMAEKVLPLTYRLQEKAKKLSAEGKPVTAKKAEACVQSLWALFPAFCNFPSDTAESFHLIAKPVGDVLTREPELRGMTCHGLQMLIKQNRVACGEGLTSSMSAENSIESFVENKAAQARAKALYSERAARANLSAIASFSRNFLPLLFNVFIAAPSEKRGDLQATIGDFASISTRKTVKEFFLTIMQKLLKATKEASELVRPKGQDSMELSGPSKEESASTRRCIFMDLALSLLKGLDDEAVGILFTSIKPTLQDVDGSVQKKGYKVLASLCKEHAGFLVDRTDEVLMLLLTALPSCHFSAKRHRLNCLHHFILYLFKSDLQEGDKLLSSFISEIILATKETNTKTRSSAYDILVQLGHSLQDADPVGSEGKLLQFFNMIVGCLAGTTPHMRSAAVTALARLIYEFHDLCHTIPDLLPSALLLLHSKSREVIKSVLGFMKVVVARQPVELLQHNLKSMVDGLLLWCDDSKNHFKAKVRVIVEMLVRRCGPQAVSAVMPEPHLKLLTHIRKMKEKKEKKSGDEKMSVRSHATTSRKSKWHHTEFFSDNEDEVGSDDDYMDTKAVTSVVKSRATTTRSSSKLRKSNKVLPEDQYGDEKEPLDLLDMQKTRSVLSVKKLKRKDYDSDELEVDSDGRLIVPDDNMSKRKQSLGMDNGEQDYGSFGVKSKNNFGAHNGAKSKFHASKKRRTDTGWAYTGEEYVNKKGTSQGDVKRKGKLDPYAYWPLDQKMLNRREGKKSVARKGLARVLKEPNKMKGRSGTKVFGSKGSTKKGGQKMHKGGKAKGKGRRH